MSKEVAISKKTEPLLEGDVKIVVTKFREEKKSRFSPICIQSVTALAVVFMFFVGGITSGFSAVLLPQLAEPGSPIPSTVETDSWIASISVLSMCPGSLLAGWVMNRFGRRTAIYIICIPLVINWIIISWADNLWLMLTGRFLGGFCLGFKGALSPIYLGETTEPKYRGFFLAGVPLAIAVGVFFSHFVGSYVRWQWAALIYAATPIVGIIFLTLAPESPLWLISKGRKEEGIKAFGKLRGYSDAATEELQGLLEQKVDEKTFDLQETIKTVKSPIFYKPTLIMILFIVLYQFSGVNAFVFYAVGLVQKSVGKSLNHYAVMLIMDAVRIVMSVAGCVVCKKFGRRPLTIITGIWTGASLFALCAFLYWFGDDAPTNLSWIPVLSLMSYTCAVSVGLTPLVWTVCGEIFPSKVRGLGASISTAVGMLSYFIVIKVTPEMLNRSEIVTFMVFGAVGFLLAVIMYFILPETFGKTIQDVEEYFDKRKSKPKIETEQIP